MVLQCVWWFVFCSPMKVMKSTLFNQANMISCWFPRRWRRRREENMMQEKRLRCIARKSQQLSCDDVDDDFLNFSKMRSYFKAGSKMSWWWEAARMWMLMRWMENWMWWTFAILIPEKGLFSFPITRPWYSGRWKYCCADEVMMVFEIIFPPMLKSCACKLDALSSSQASVLPRLLFLSLGYETKRSLHWGG